MADESADPPGFAYLSDIGDLISRPVPRNVVIVPRRWMEPYHRLEELELGRRLHSAKWVAKRVWRR